MYGQVNMTSFTQLMAVSFAGHAEFLSFRREINSLQDVAGLHLTGRIKVNSEYQTVSTAQIQRLPFSCNSRCLKELERHEFAQLPGCGSH